MNKNENLSEEFIENLSAYADNELDSAQNIKIKKLAIANSEVRKELENLYSFKKLLHAAFERTKNEFKKDYSKNITSKIAEDDYYSTSYFKKIAVLFVAIISAIIGGFIYLYF